MSAWNFCESTLRCDVEKAWQIEMFSDVVLSSWVEPHVPHSLTNSRWWPSCLCWPHPIDTLLYVRPSDWRVDCVHSWVWSWHIYSPVCQCPTHILCFHRTRNWKLDQWRHRWPPMVESTWYSATKKRQLFSDRNSICKQEWTYYRIPGQRWWMKMIRTQWTIDAQFRDVKLATVERLIVETGMQWVGNSNNDTIRFGNGIRGILAISILHAQLEKNLFQSLQLVVA